MSHGAILNGGHGGTFSTDGVLEVAIGYLVGGSEAEGDQDWYVG